MRALRPVGAFALAIVPLLGAAEPPTEQPVSPPEATLSQVAKSIKLRLPPGKRKLDNQTVKQLGEGAELTTTGADRAPKPLGKAYWQQRYQEARARVLGLELLLQRFHQQLREGKAQGATALILERSARRAETELELMRLAPESVRRQALAEGCKPEWFANLPQPEPIYPQWVTKLPASSP